jgi:hypothetical protein
MKYQERLVSILEENAMMKTEESIDAFIDGLKLLRIHPVDAQYLSRLIRLLYYNLEFDGPHKTLLGLIDRYNKEDYIDTVLKMLTELVDNKIRYTNDIIIHLLIPDDWYEYTKKAYKTLDIERQSLLFKAFQSLLMSCTHDNQIYAEFQHKVNSIIE